MYHSIVKNALIAAAVFLAANMSFAADKKLEASAATTDTAKSAAKGSTPKKTAASAKVKLVDINDASKAELKKLPGISDADANKIIAGRPYRTKAHLVTHRVIPRGLYEGIKKQIIARQHEPLPANPGSTQAIKRSEKM